MTSRQQDPSVPVEPPPRYEDALRERRFTPPAPLLTTEVGSNDMPPDYYESVREQPAPSRVSYGLARSAPGEDDEFNDAACLCAVFCIALKLLSVFGR